MNASPMTPGMGTGYRSAGPHQPIEADHCHDLELFLSKIIPLWSLFHPD
jgi:hypothetical protein